MNTTNNFTSKESILARVNGTKDQFLTLTGWIRLDDEIESLINFDEKLKVIDAAHKVVIENLLGAPTDLAQFDYADESIDSVSSLEALIFVEHTFPMIEAMAQACFVETMDCSVKENVNCPPLESANDLMESVEMIEPSHEIEINDSALDPYLSTLKNVDIYGDEDYCRIASKVYTTIRACPSEKEKFMEEGEWVWSNKPSKCPVSSIRPILEEWNEKYSRCNFNFSPVVKVVRLFLVARSPYVVSLKLLITKYVGLVRCVSFIKRRINELIDELNNSIVYQSQLDSGEKSLDDLVTIISNGDFGVFNCEMSRRSMETLAKAIARIPGSEEFFRIDGNLFSKNPIANELSHSKEIQEMGHSGGSMSWTFAQFKDIYQNGWKTWVYRIFINRGIGWEQTNFDEAYTYKIEECIVYHLEKRVLASGNSDDWSMVSQEHTFKEVLEYAMDSESDKLLGSLLKLFGHKLTVDDYWTYAGYCDDNLKNGVRHLFHQHWIKHHPRTVDLT